MYNLFEALEEVNRLLQESKPGDRSDIDRHYAILLTELEKFKALAMYYLDQ